MSRVYCDRCSYPLQQCICDLLISIKGGIHLILLQDEKEARHAKNTARLLSMAYQPIHVVSMAEPYVMPSLPKDLTSENAILLFPSEKASALSALKQDYVDAKLKYVILLDATWRKAKKMLYCCPELSHFKQGCLSGRYDGKYQIRHTSVTSGLSTFEAACYAVEELTEQDATALVEMMVACHQRQWLRYKDAINLKN